MRHVNYWRGSEWLGNDVNIGEYLNDEERCPFCHSKVSTVFCETRKHDDGLYYDDPIGCFHCIASSDDEEDEFLGDFDPFDPVWEREKRMLCRGTAYEY